MENAAVVDPGRTAVFPQEIQEVCMYTGKVEDRVIYEAAHGLDF